MSQRSEKMNRRMDKYESRLQDLETRWDNAARYAANERHRTERRFDDLRNERHREAARSQKWDRVNRVLATILLSLSAAVAAVYLFDMLHPVPVVPAVQEHQQAPEVIVEILPDVPAADPLEAEKLAISKAVWGEARGCNLEGQENVVWTVLGRYDDGRFGDSIVDVVSAPGQFIGYRESNPVDPQILATTERIVNRWLDGDPGPGYLYFTGDGKQNHFREG